jgi:hypothetical protein
VLLCHQLSFPSKTWFWGIYLNFQWQKSLKNQYLPHSESKSYQTNSIKSCSLRSFQQHQRHIPIPLKKLSFDLINFQWKNHSIFMNFCTASPNVMEPSPCTSLLRAFQRHQEHNLKHPLSLVDLITTKQNKLPSFIDRYLLLFCSKVLTF